MSDFLKLDDWFQIASSRIPLLRALSGRLGRIDVSLFPANEVKRRTLMVCAVFVMHHHTDQSIAL